MGLRCSGPLQGRSGKIVRIATPHVRLDFMEAKSRLQLAGNRAGEWNFMIHYVDV